MGVGLDVSVNESVAAIGLARSGREAAVIHAGVSVGQGIAAVAPDLIDPQVGAVELREDDARPGEVFGARRNLVGRAHAVDGVGGMRGGREADQQNEQAEQQRAQGGHRDE